MIDYQRKYRSENIEKIRVSRRVYERNRRRNDVNYRIIQNTRKRIHHALNGKSKSLRTKKSLGIDLPNYKKWTEFQMTPEMSWSNIEIDHIKPLSSFNVSNEEEILEAFNWKKTQPLLKEDHLKKGNKFNPQEYTNQFRKAREFNLMNTFLNSNELL